MIKTFLILYSLFIIIHSEALKCGDKEIENCEQCGTGENSNTCIKCKDKHFLFFNNLYCLPCDDKNYGQVGCGGNCKSTNLNEERIIECNLNDCKEGYYNLNGICFPCSREDSSCKICNITDDFTFICKECISNEFKINQYGKCQSCYIANCAKCNYINNYTDAECEKCYYNYYLSSFNKECKKCKTIDINNGHCTVCSDNETDNKYEDCWCNSHYTKKDNSTCVECPNGCQNCNFNKLKNIKECTHCNNNYVLNSNKTCSYCGDGCQSCKLDNDLNPICISCNSGYSLVKNKCLNCPENCNDCTFGNNNAIICKNCKDNYILNSNGICKYCNNCEKCYIKDNGEAACLSCNPFYTLDQNEQCIKCSTIKSIGGAGCMECEYNKEKNKFDCLNCKYGYIPIINDKICKKSKEMNLSEYCYEAENIGTEEKPIYSCSKCNDYTLNITNSNNINNCHEREGKLINCLEGSIDKKNNLICIKCDSNGHFNISNICECNSDSFSRDGKCYKCNDSNYGNIGCEPSKGCKYINSQLTCNQCKNDFFKYMKECFSCSGEIEYCNKCSLDSDEQFECEGCISNYIYNKEGKYCELFYEEYPQISPGCIIFNDTYKSQKKCQICKPGYFKAKDESCILCKSQNYGGSSCDECEYEKDENGKETKNIKCKYCGNIYQTSDSEGKCYNCKIEIEGCDSCTFITNGNKEKLICTLCSPGYYLDTNGNCINYLEYVGHISNCYYMNYSIGNITFIYYISDKRVYFEYFYYNNISYYSALFYSIFGEDNFTEFINKNTKEIKSPIKGSCERCMKGHYLNDDGNCIQLTIDRCTLNSIIKNRNLLYLCKDLCYNNKYSLIVLDNNFSYCENCTYIEFIEISSLVEQYIYNYEHNYKIEETEDELKYLGEKTICVDNSGKGGKNTPENLKYCHIAKYLENEDKYICIKCLYDYILDDVNICKKKINNEGIQSCDLENIGTKDNPIYSCKKCYNIKRYNENNNNYNDINDYYNYFSHYYSDSDYYNYINIKEDSKSLCIKDEKEELKYCLDAVVDTTYVKYKYNCTKCIFNYLPYYSQFYDRKMCQNIFENITTEKNISFNIFNDIESIPTIDGKCIKNTLFTPDGKNCYECNNEDVGMPGCKGSCNFSLKRSDIIKCEGECDNGYIESSEGVCEPCDNINKGCYECHYENEYPNNYIGIKLKRRFVCDLCEDGYIKSDGKCYSCSDLQKNCEKCNINSNNEYACIKCGFGYYLTQNEMCQKCNGKDQFILGTDKCVQCNDANNGGIKGCQYCEKNEDNIICNLCEDNYILLTNNNTCLKRKENNELNKLIRCEQLTLDKNNKLYCSRCKKEFSLLIENNLVKCTYIPTIYDYFYEYEDYRYSYMNMTMPIKSLSSDLYENYYYNYIYDDLMPCQETVNIGLQDRPLYTCNKCYNLFEYDKLYENENILLLDENTNISHCINNIINKDLNNCTKAVKKLYGRTKKYNCIQCAKDNVLVYNFDTNISYCMPMNTTNKCMVKYCKKCKSGNNYICDTCISSDYIVNIASGACIKKTDIVPSITWKDIFRLQLNSVKEINGRNIYGPSLRLRGITNSKINTRDAFLIYLIFKIKQKELIRNLEEDSIKMTTICEILKGKTDSDQNMVDYECIGESNNIENLQNYELIDIEEGNNTDILKNSNFKEIVTNTQLRDLENKKNPNFQLKDLYKNKEPLNTDNNIINETDEITVSTILITNETSDLDNKNDDDNKIKKNKEDGKKNKTTIILVAASITIVALLLIIIISCCICKRKKKTIKEDLSLNNTSDNDNISKGNISST